MDDPTEILTSYLMKSESGVFAFCDPCELDDGFGDRADMPEQIPNRVRFAAGAGLYLLAVRERDFEGWGRRTVGLELVPASDEGRVERDWEEIGFIAVDTGTALVFDPAPMQRASLVYDQLFGDLNSAGNVFLHPDAQAFMASIRTGFGDGGYDVEVDGPRDAARAVRVIFVD